MLHTPEERIKCILWILVIEIKANDRHDSGRLRGPNFLRIRTDKPWKECIITERKSENKQKMIGDF